MATSHTIEQLLAPYGPRLPLPELVRALNQLYHRFEAADYDRRHPEIHRQLPELWREMVAVARREHGARPWRVLNLGCGTGFEAAQLLGWAGPETIAELHCYDPSPEMLARCQARLGPLFPSVSLQSELDALQEGPYDLLITNALLHHLPQPLALIAAVLPRLAPDALWLAGHEPSRRFYANPECLRLYQRFQRAERRRRLLAPAAYVGRLSHWLGRSADPVSRTAHAAARAGLFRRRPSRLAIARTVDLHVAHSAEEAADGRGFDIRSWRDELDWAWRNLWFRSYGFIGPHHEGDLGAPWAAEAAALAARFPDDGASFCSVWGRRR